jgi:guanylate kinase
MAQLIQEGAFIETAEFSGNLYGTSKKAIQVGTKRWREEASSTLPS